MSREDILEKIQQRMVSNIIKMAHERHVDEDKLIEMVVDMMTEEAERKLVEDGLI